jgi:CubicO group peptidase (beta-lactamase class C family)
VPSRFAFASLVVVASVACRDKEKEKNVPTSQPVASGSAARTLEQELAAVRSKHDLPALAAAVWKEGKLVERAAVGTRKRGDDAHAVTVNDRWHIGSNTKAMTATLIGIYVDRGAVKWTDTIDKFFSKIDPGYAKVTLDQLIRHTGGAPSEPPGDLWAQLWTDGANADARAKFVAGVLALKPAQSPGTFAYSNQGYMIAGAMLEKATGKRWEDLMRDELFAKLGMTSCGFGPPGRAGAVEEPWGHDASGKPMEPGPTADNPPGLGPAGTVHCSLEDYGKFLAMHSTGEPALVTPETMQHLHTPRGGDYAGGWGVMTNERGTALVHSGSNTLWYTTALVARTPKNERWIFVMTTNSGSGAIESSFGELVMRHLGK